MKTDTQLQQDVIAELKWEPSVNVAQIGVSRLLTALFAAASLSLAGTAIGQSTAPRAPATTSATMSKDSYNAERDRAAAAYKAAKEACSTMSANAKDICMAEAKGEEKMAKAEAEAAYKNTPRARESARMAKADMEYNVAKEKCDDLSGNPKDVCVKEAKAAHTKTKGDAKVDRVAVDTSRTASDKKMEARKDAAEDKRDADYKVAIEKCDALSGAATDNCVRDAKVKFGKS